MFFRLLINYIVSLQQNIYFKLYFQLFNLLSFKLTYLLKLSVFYSFVNTGAELLKLKTD